MKTIKQLLRQPLKTAIGIVIVALAFAILVTCVGQYTGTDLTRENVDDRYTTIGLLSSKYFMEKINGGMKYLSRLPEETQEWIDRLIYNHSDIVKEVSSTGLVSAYIPDLTIENFSKYEYGYKMSDYNEGYPYRCAMLTVTLTKIGTVGAENIRRMEVGGQVQTLVDNTTFLCVGTVESVVGLEKGFVSPVGKTIVLHVKVFDQAAFDALDLQVGQTYLVYGEDYLFESTFSLMTQIMNNQSAYENLFGKLKYKHGGLGLDYSPMLEQFDCTLTLYDPASLPSYAPVTDGTGKVTGFAASGEWRQVYNKSEKGISTKWIPTENYISYYQLPTIVPLNGSVDDFLTSEAGTLWQGKLDEMGINNHGFPVLCVDKLGYQAAFAREEARVVDGRDFTEGELLNSEKVCIISQSVAARSGLKVGDTIELQTYAYDPTFSFQLNDMTKGAAFPNAALYSKALGFTSEKETYTIVGLYRQENAWQNRYDDYGFTPNTIFVPKSSVTAEMEIRNKGLYTTLVLHNGKIDEFKALMEEARYPDLFICYDQGYSEFVASLDAYEEISQKALYIGLAAFVAIILLFLLLYPAQQKRSLMLMGTLGASAWGRFTHTFISILCVLVSGAALGGYVGSKLWTRIAAALMEWINIEIALESDMTAIAPKLTAASLAVVALAALLVSAALCRNRGLMKRK